MKEKLKSVKVDSSLFILYSSFCESIAFAPRKVSFDRAKGYVSSPQTYPLARQKLKTLYINKLYFLSRSQTERKEP